MSQAITYQVVFNARDSVVSVTVAGVVFHGVEANTIHNDFIHTHGARFVTQRVLNGHNGRLTVATYMV